MKFYNISFIIVKVSCWLLWHSEEPEKRTDLLQKPKNFKRLKSLNYKYVFITILDKMEDIIKTLYIKSPVLSVTSVVFNHVLVPILII